MRNIIEVEALKEQEEGSPIHGDLLEEVFAHVPLIDLACASRVSKTWEFAVSSSLFHLNKLKPWLVIQTQNTTSLSKAKAITTHAFDPRSNTWIEISQLSYPTKIISPLKSSGSTLFYQLSNQGLSFSVDPLHLTWHHIPPPTAWRVDPIVAVVGPHVIVAGGDTGFWDDPLTVEMYDMEGSHWSMCQSMPPILKDSTASTWLSVASNQHMMYVTEKASGVTYSFSPITKTWYGPYNLVPDPSVYHSVIGFSSDNLILAGLMGHAQNVTTLKLWKVDPKTMAFDEIGKIPNELLEKLKGPDSNYLSSISLLATKDFCYIYKSSDPTEIIFCEFVQGNCKWSSVRNMVLNDERKIGERIVMSCGRIEIPILHLAMESRNLKFVAKSHVKVH